MSAADLHIDFETKSDVNLKVHGSHIYFESPITAPLMGSYARTGGLVKRWLPHEPCPAEIVDHARSGGRFVAHNASQFEFLLWTKVLTPRYGWPEIGIHQFRCTMATAAALGLPRALDKLGDTLGLTVKKDKIGKSLIQFFCVPRKNQPGEIGVHFNEPADHPEKFEQFRGYCDDDVRTEMEADSRMIPLSADEEKVWQLDAVINARGIRIDRASVVAAMALVEKAKAELDRQMKVVTGGAVTAASQVARLKEWLASRGVVMDGVAKDDILEALDEDIPDDARGALLIRQEAGKTSLAKLPSFLKHAGANDRMRGLYVYHGAGPGRWCLAEGSTVLVKTPFDDVLEKPIENVDWCDQVWDGDNWVAHDGVVFSGVKDVITHDGVTATPEHIVYLDDTSYAPLGTAKREGASIYGRSPSIYDLRCDVSVGKKVCRDDSIVGGETMEGAYSTKPPSNCDAPSRPSDK